MKIPKTVKVLDEYDTVAGSYTLDKDKLTIKVRGKETDVARIEWLDDERFAYVVIRSTIPNIEGSRFVYRRVPKD